MVERQTLTDTSTCSGVNSNRLHPEKVEGNYIRLRVRCRPKTVKPRGLSPRYFTLWQPTDVVGVNGVTECDSK